MRLLHTSDWHLGKVLHGASLLDDQAHVLRELVALAADLRPDAIVVAGDIYDRALPPVAAVEVLDETLSRLVNDLAIPTILIAGNHDSPERVGFAGRILGARGLHVIGAPSSARVISLDDAYGRVEMFALPYCAPEAVAGEIDSVAEGGDRSEIGEWRERASGHAQPEEASLPETRRLEALASTGAADVGERARDLGGPLSGHDAALRWQIRRARERQGTCATGARRIAVAHAFVVGGTATDSERVLSVGGSGVVGTHAFSEFDYVALGHLHRPQSVGRATIRYSGSLLPYSFSEVDTARGTGHVKSVSLVELGQRGDVRITEHTLSQRRGFRVVTGAFADVIAGGSADAARDDWVAIRLIDSERVLDAMARVRADAYPNALSLEYVPQAPGSATVLVAARARERGGMVDTFAGFFAEVVGRPCSAAELQWVMAVHEGPEAAARLEDRMRTALTKKSSAHEGEAP